MTHFFSKAEYFSLETPWDVKRNKKQEENDCKLTKESQTKSYTETLLT